MNKGHPIVERVIRRDTRDAIVRVVRVVDMSVREANVDQTDRSHPGHESELTFESRLCRFASTDVAQGCDDRDGGSIGTASDVHGRVTPEFRAVLSNPAEVQTVGLVISKHPVPIVEDLVNVLGVDDGGPRIGILFDRNASNLPPG